MRHSCWPFCSALTKTWQKEFNLNFELPQLQDIELVKSQVLRRLQLNGECSRRKKVASGYCTKTINSLGGVTVTMPNEILVSLTGPGTCDAPKKIFVNVTKYTWKKNSPKIAENSIIFEPKNHFVWPLEDA